MIKSNDYKYFAKLKTSLLILCLFVMVTLSAQDTTINVQVPPPPCYANGNSGFGGAVGLGEFLASDPNSVVQFNLSTGGNDMNDILVFYIDTGAVGRNTIDLNVDDSADPHRIAITNSNVSGFGSLITFPSGFEASYAVAVNTDFAGLWSIPTTGTVGDNGLNFITAVTSTLTSNSQISYQISFNWSDIGLTENDSFDFVGVYVSNSGYSSDEAYGSGIVSGTEGSDALTFNGYLSFPECNATLGEPDKSTINIDAKYFDDVLSISGFNANARVRVYDILGQEVYSEYHQIQNSATIPLKLNKKQLYFIVIQSSDQKKVIKVMPD